MTRGSRMGAEVGQVAAKLSRAVECSTCGIGIAVDMVGKRWGEDPYDWKGERFGHECNVARNGLTPEQVRVVAQIEVDLEKWSHTQRGGGEYQAPLVDPRLPPERDDVENNA